MYLIILPIALTIGFCSCQGQLPAIPSGIPGCEEQSVGINNEVMKCSAKLLSYGGEVGPELLGSPSTEILNTLCTEVKNAQNCITRYMSNLNCIQEPLKGMLQLGFKSINSIVNYVCDSNAVVFQDFFKNNGVFCLMSAKDPIYNCTKDSFSADTLAAMQAGQDPTKLACDSEKPLKKCISGPLKGASCKPRIIEILNGVIDAYISPFNCNGELNQGSTAGSNKNEGSTTGSNKNEGSTTGSSSDGSQAAANNNNDKDVKKTKGNGVSGLAATVLSLVLPIYINLF